MNEDDMPQLVCDPDRERLQGENLDGLQVGQVHRAATRTAEIPDVVAGVTVRHGRDSIHADTATAGAEWTMHVAAGDPWGDRLSVGDTVSVWVLRPMAPPSGGWEWVRRFVGFVASMDAETGPDGMSVQVTAVGWSAVLGSVWGARQFGEGHAIMRVWSLLDTDAKPVLDTLGAELLPYLLQWNGDPFDPILAAETEPRSASILDRIGTVLAETGGIIHDTIDGRIAYETVGFRSRPETPWGWWANAGYTPPAGRFEWDMTTRSEWDIINRVHVAWTGGTFTLDDPISQARWGIWEDHITTTITTEQQASVWAARILRRQGMPGWSAPSVTVRCAELDRYELRHLQNVGISSPIVIPGPPQPWPTTVQRWIIEGWTEHIPGPSTVESGWTITLHLSPPRLSSVSMRWAEWQGTWADKTGLTWALAGSA
jgi:hypothetical protein